MSAKTIVITGAGMGIGAETARHLAAGNRLLLHYHSSAETALALQAELKPLCASVDVVAADLTTDDGCLSLFRTVSTQFDALDVLVNNAGGMIERQAVEDLDWRHLSDTFALNTFSAMRLTGLCTGLLRHGSNPCVVNVTSIAMRHGAPTATAYGAAKSALDAFTRGAANELAPHIRVNAVAPGIIDTRFHERVTSPEKMRQFVDSTPLKRAGTVVDVARTITFLIDNEFMTGETVDCNGGLSMR
ncbi:SDR family oxidoreductase [Streptomyces sp. NA02950]|uniref:SDR family NAD(P)-dependent oxidoreductase n=1 Tax=Streptomyces sp. NA02950 TaxID=2742137 RepID=UPI001592949E|nr:SDR family oxidoreductase [Streptomyces sp. NA02950]QKV96305.1 SDR family oxidoreductase [Streptomyces sp. NA02950]